MAEDKIYEFVARLSFQVNVKAKTREEAQEKINIMDEGLTQVGGFIALEEVDLIHVRPPGEFHEEDVDL